MSHWDNRGGYRPFGSVPHLREALQPAFNSEDLFETMLSRENLQRAWAQVKANKGCPGSDGMTIEDFPTWARQHWPTCKAKLLKGHYRPQPVLRAEIDKPDGGKRLLGVPSVIDRVIQQAITQVMTPIFDPHFSENSFGYRPKRSATQAVKQVQGFIKDQRRIAVDVDISKFFDRVDHDILMSKVVSRIRDKCLLKLIGKYLRAGILDKGKLLPSTIGVPQGGPLSPLLSNIMLDSLDKELEARGHKFARYADDFIILVKSQTAGERVQESITRFLETRLKLTVNNEKSQVVKVSQAKFMGFTFKANKIHWHPKTLDKFKHRVRELTNRNWGVSMPYQIHKLSLFLRGWINFFGIANAYQKCVDLDEWIRRRLR
jgi:RNA-directed DNA polymerase